MQFLDLIAQYKSIKAEIDEAVIKTLESGVFIGGSQVEGFEKKATEFIGVKHAVSVNSGTDALFLTLKSLGIGAGDEVITTPFTFIATAEVVAAAGATPVFADIDPRTFNIDQDKIEAKITKKTKAVIPVHLYGQMSRMDKITGLAKKYNLKIIEDCAQAMGACQRIGENTLNAGAAGNAGCFSFFPSKTLGACGDGGLVATNDPAAAGEIKILKSHGSAPNDRYLHLRLGVNSRLDAIQAAILAVKIKYLDEWNQVRGQKADYYNANLKGIGDIMTPFVADGNAHVYHQYTVRTAKRDELRKYLTAGGIPTMVYYPIPLHLQPAFEHLEYEKGDFPEAELAASQVLSLPVYPQMTVAQQDQIIQKIKDFYGQKN